MRQGLTLQGLAEQVQRTSAAKRDFIAPSRKLYMVEEEGQVKLNLSLPAGSTTGYSLTNHAHAQVAQKWGVPKPYYDRMLAEAPDLLAMNLNRWLQKDETRSTMIRTINGKARAVLSDRYRPIDNDIILEGVLPHLMQAGVEIKSAEITETRLYLQVVTPRVSATLPSRQGEIIQAGLTISNSEVGAGSVWFANLLYFLSCLNGAIGTVDHRKYHIGKKLSNGEEAAFVNFSDQTKMLDDKAYISGLKDMTVNALSQLSLDREVKALDAAATREIKATRTTEAIEEITKRYGMTEIEGEGILSRIIKGGDLTQYGLGGAITNLANSEEEVVSFDRVIELQKIGSEVLLMSEGTFKEIAQ